MAFSVARLRVFWLIWLIPLSAAQMPDFIRQSAPELLTFDELVQLAGNAAPTGELGLRVGRLLNTPFLSNEAWFSGARPHAPFRQDVGPILRACMWNIERGAEFELIRLAFSDPGAFIDEVTKRTGVEPPDLKVPRHQAELLRDSDVLVLNEVDLGMTRTDFRFVARELAAALNMNYAFGVEFIEVDKINLGLEKIEAPDKEANEELQKALEVDRSRYRGLHGTAILTRFPIKSARILRFRICYDWFRKEQDEIAKLERARRWSADRLFLERISREVRHGDRMAVIAELEVPGLPEQAVTVVAAHLENKCPPDCRRIQMEELLAEIRNVTHPVILAGDLNTTGKDAAPTSIRREISRRVRNPKFWAGQAVKWFNPVSLPATLTLPANYFRNYLDPTARHIPFISPNPEARLFKAVEEFRFRDGYRFDFRGDLQNEKDDEGGSTLGNSNQRAGKGFRQTFSLERDFKGLVGRFKLDWFLVKPYIRDARDPAGSRRFAPRDALTMLELNEAVPDGISDHTPITVDLPLSEPDSAG